MRTICLTLYLFKREIMAKGKKTSGKEKGLYTDPATLIMELFRTLPDKRYSVKSLSAAAGAATREQKDQVRAIVHDFLRQGVIRQVSEGKYSLSGSQRETVEGTVDMTSSGALYVIVEGMDKDVYVNASRAGTCAARRRVKVAITRKGAAEIPKGRSSK